MAASAPRVVVANASRAQFAVIVVKQCGATNTLEFYDYLLQHGDHVDTANATSHKVHYWI